MTLMDLKIGQFVGFVDRPTSRPPREPSHHYMLRVVPNRELAVEEKLKARGVVVYLPKETETRKTGWNRYRARTVAIFAGAIFIPDFEADLRRLKDKADAIIGYVRCESKPVIIRPKMMEAIRKFEKLLDVPAGQRKRAFKVGQQVMVKCGVFEMWMGRVERLDRNHRLSVLVEFLGRMVSVELGEDQVEAV
jgi:transcription antitermination factor NusG